MPGTALSTTTFLALSCFAVLLSVFAGCAGQRRREHTKASRRLLESQGSDGLGDGLEGDNLLYDDEDNVDMDDDSHVPLEEEDDLLDDPAELAFQRGD
jgi:hypothetical protein